MKKTLTSIVVLAALALNGTTDALAAGFSNSTILHAWSWSFRTIADNMKRIADAGYDFVQTSPANTCFVGEDGGMALMSKPGDAVKGKWYYYYQPTDWKIGNYMLGTRDDFKAMCDSAKAYGVKVLVDVLPNHVAIDHTAVKESLDSAVGGHENLFHANGLTEIRDYNDRYQCTTGQMGGLPDVNTENPDFQYYYLQYINDVISCGASGFRYDTAKHIGLPSDPLDEKATRNNFWEVAMGREPVKGLSLCVPREQLYIYGEILQDKYVKEEEYASYMEMCASQYGYVLRNALNKHNFYADSLRDWHHTVAPEHLITWVESHDNYCNAHESAGMDDALIRMGWVFLTARKDGCPLFFSRPMGSTRENYWGNNRIGERGNDEFFHPEVVAVNRFRKDMAGLPEKITATTDGSVIEVTRGNRGVALINIATKKAKVRMTTSLPDGKYRDRVYGKKFKVKHGILTGKLNPLQSYIIER